MQRSFFNFILALEGINANKLRSFLTALGIIFGVGAVISMLAIGAGAKQSILDQMKLIGTNNIVIQAKTTQTAGEEESAGEEETSNQEGGEKPYSPGLTLQDVKAITMALPTIERVSPEVVLPINVVRAGKLKRSRCIGVTNDFFELNKLAVDIGSYFHPMHLENGRPVAIIGKDVQARFFSEENPIGKHIKCGRTWLTVIGVLERRGASRENLRELGIRNYNEDVYVPVTTALLRFKNRAVVASDDLQRRGRNNQPEENNYNQLDRLVVRIDESDRLQASADVIARLLKRRHKNLVDFEIEVPELLLEQEQKTQETFNLVLAVIAGISLLVGGIGIMNIMLASVMERIKEIGVRRSLGANRRDIILQFLFEAVFISLIGGLIGMLLGVLSAKIISSYAEIPTIISAWSILLSFGVAATVGLVFGIFPARKAARQDPIKALRSD
jgi:putative ABC transport system permease protein